MEEALHTMLTQRARLRTPRVFFLNRDDYAEFMATKPELIDYPTFAGGHPVTLELPRFANCAVRESQGKGSNGKPPASVLYSYAGTTKMVRDR
jgi:hypothetical protein